MTSWSKHELVGTKLDSRSPLLGGNYSQLATERVVEARAGQEQGLYAPNRTT